MPVDPRLNCAAEICCGPPPGIVGEEAALNQPAHTARVGILVDLGISEEKAHKVSKRMVEQGLCFMPQELADVMREIAFAAKEPQP